MVTRISQPLYWRMRDAMTISENIQTDRPEAEGAYERLPVGQLLAFTVAGFLAIMTENMPAARCSCWRLPGS